MRIKTYRPITGRGDPRCWINKLLFRDPWYTKSPQIHLDRWDTWDIAYTLSPLIRDLLVQLKETGHGYPSVFSEYTPNEWESREEYDKALMSGKHRGGGEKAWNDIMTDMIWSFEQASLEDMDEGFHSGEIDFYVDEKGYLQKGPNHTHTFDQERYAHYFAKVQEGIDLFAEYYFGLWD